MVLRRLEGRARRPGVGTYQDGDMRGHVTGLVWRRGLVSAVDQNANSRARGSRMNPKRLNQMMMRDDQTPHTLLNLFAKHKDNFDYVNLSTCLKRLTELTIGPKAARQLEGDEHFRELLAQIERRACEFGSRLLATTMHNLGSLTQKGFRWEKRETSMLVSAIVGSAETKTKDFTPQHLSNFTWGLGKMVSAGQLEVSKPMKEWIEAAAKQGKLKIADFKAQGLSNFTWGLGTMVGAGQLEVSKLIKTSISLCVAHLLGQPSGHVTTQCISNVLLALATFGDGGPVARPVIQRLVGAAKATDFGCEYQELANTLFSMQVLQVGQYDAFEMQGVKTLLSAFDRGLLSGEDACQLHQVLHCMEEEAGPNIATQEQRQAIRKAFVAFTTSGTRRSSFQRDVGKTLSGMGVDYVEVHNVEGMGYMVDVALVDKKVALEVDGPSHFWRDMETRTWRYNGSTMLKQRLLEKLGWRVERVPLHEWQLLKSAEERESYLGSKVYPASQG